jgi:multidrug efflux system membrane fusion protein
MKNLAVKNKFMLAVAGLALVLAAGCSRVPAGKAAAPVPVLTALAVATNMPVLIDPPPVGHVLPVSMVTIRSQIGGTIATVNFQEGQEVKKGDLLFTIDPRPSQAALARDQAQLENAQVQFDREQKLFDQKLVSQDEYDTSRAAKDTLVATVQTDELNLGFCEIRAPFDGVTGGLQFHEGNVVKAPDDVLLTINQIRPIYVQFGVLEQFLPAIKKQMRTKTLPVSVTFQNMDVPPPAGELTFIDNSVDETTGLIQLRATFPNADRALWPGQFVKVTLQLDELTNAIVVPSQAVQAGQNGPFIYVVKPDQTVEERPVTVGLAYQNETVVEKGLAAGETVVTDGQLRLVPGVKVNVKSSIESAAAVSTNAP